MEAQSLYAQQCEPNHCNSNPDHNARLGYEHWNINMGFFSESLLKAGIFSFSPSSFEVVVCEYSPISANRSLKCLLVQNKWSLYLIGFMKTPKYLNRNVNGRKIKRVVTNAAHKWAPAALSSNPVKSIHTVAVTIFLDWNQASSNRGHSELLKLRSCFCCAMTSLRLCVSDYKSHSHSAFNLWPLKHPVL